MSHIYVIKDWIIIFSAAMGIEICYRRLTIENFQKLHNDNAYAKDYFGIDLEADDEIYSHYERLKASGRYLDLDKHWQSLYFILIGDSPFNCETSKESVFHKLFIGGTATKWSATYGMVRYLTVNEVNEIAQALNNFSSDNLYIRLNMLLGSDKNSIYMEPYLLNLHTQLTDFFTKAAQSGDIVLLSLN